MNRFFTLAIAVIVFLAIFVLAKQPAGWRRELEERDEKYKTSLDSLQGVSRALEIRGTELQEKIDSLSNSLKSALNKADQWKQRYNHEKSRPVTRFSDPQLDSLIARYR